MNTLRRRAAVLAEVRGLVGRGGGGGGAFEPNQQLFSFRYAHNGAHL